MCASLAFTLALSIMTALFFGVVPLAAGMRREVTDALREGARAPEASASTPASRSDRDQRGLRVRPPRGVGTADSIVQQPDAGRIRHQHAQRVESRGVAAACRLQPGAADPFVLPDAARSAAHHSRRQVGGGCHRPAAARGRRTPRVHGRRRRRSRAREFGRHRADLGARRLLHHVWSAADSRPQLHHGGAIREPAGRDREQEPRGSVLARPGSDRQTVEVGPECIFSGAMADRGRRRRRRGGRTARQRSGDPRLHAVLRDERPGTGQPDRRTVASTECGGERPRSTPPR